MVSVKMKLLLALLIICFVQVVYNAKCPAKLGIPCTNSVKCKGAELERCYRDLDGTPNSTLSYCCRMACPTTKLLTFHTERSNTFLHKLDEKLNKEGELYYNDPSSIACPYPYSHATIKMDKTLPDGFSVNSTEALKKCTTNGDCGEGFYCGSSVNPSFDDDTKDVTQVDKSDDGLPIKHCYKDPDFGKEFKVAFDASKIGLPICNKDSECLGMRAICYQYGESEESLNAYDKSKGRGICAKALLCGSTENSTLSEGVFTNDGGYCTSENDCNGIRDEIFTSQCVKLEHAKTTSVSLCCFTPKTCEHGSPKIPKVSCSSNVDCNQGTSGAWSSWCDQKGYCCQDTTGTVQHLCPDGATFLFNEPTCEGKCKNGTCINGRCCPGLVIEDGRMTKLGTSPYITKMMCDPSKPLPDHVRLSYCSPDGFVTVIGSNDAFGEPFVLNGKKECQTNAECEQEGDMILCIRGNSTSSACNKDPFQSYSKAGDSSFPITYIIIGVIVVICVVAVGLAGWFGIRKLNKVAQKERKKREYNRALAAFQTNVTEAASRLVPKYDVPLLDGKLPNLTYDNVILVIKTGWKKYACLNNLPAFKVKCFYDYGGWFMTKVDYVRQKMRFANMKVDPTYFHANPDILQVDVDRGNTPRVDVSLKRLTLDPEADRHRILSQGDDMENDPSTEKTEDETLEVDKTQSDRSNRAKAGGDEDDLIVLIIKLIVGETIQSPDEAIAIIKREAAKKLKEEIYLNRSNFVKFLILVFMAPVKVAHNIFSPMGRLALRCIGFNKEPQIAGNHDYNLPERLEAGRDKQPWSFDRFSAEKMETYKQNVAEVSFGERITTIKCALAHGDEMLTRAEFYDNLIAAYNGKWKNSPGKEVETLDEALVDVCQAIKEFGETRNLMERKFAIYLNKLLRKATPKIWKEAMAVLDKLIVLDENAMNLQTRAELLYAHLRLSKGQRHSLFDTTEVYVNKMMADLTRANELLPNQPRIFVLMALIQKAKGNMATARRHMYTATRIQPTNADEAAQKREAINVNRIF